MALSTELLELLKVLDRSPVSVSYLIDHLGDMIADDPPHESSREQRDAEETTIEIQKLVELVVRAKQEPGFRVSSSTIAVLRTLISESHLDEYFTLQALTSIAGVTHRWQTLAHLGFANSPGKTVAGYLRQAVGCYLYGMYDAAAVLCRTALEFALRERLGSVGLMSGQIRTELERLIEFCAKSRLLTPDIRGKADRVRKLGNGAIHTSSCGERKALGQLLDTREVLAHLYGEVVASPI